jgi:allose kinase
MEAGHIPFFGNGRQCGCGKAGCAESYASGRAAKSMLDACYPGMDFASVFLNHADDEPVVELIESIAVTIATLVNLFDPHMLFLGGGVLSDVFPKARLEEAVRRHALSPYPKNDLDIRFSQHDHFAGVMGAAFYASRK